MHKLQNDFGNSKQNDVELTKWTSNLMPQSFESVQDHMTWQKRDWFQFYSADGLI